MRIRLLPEAERDLELGADFYESQLPGLGNYFTTVIVGILLQFVRLQWRLPWASDSQNEYTLLINEENDAVDATATSFEQHLSHIDLRAIIVFERLPVRVSVVAEANKRVVVGIKPGSRALP